MAVAGNAIFLRKQKGNANIVDVHHTLSETTMARSKIWMILDKTRTMVGQHDEQQ